MLIYVGLLLLTCYHSVLAAACIKNDQCWFTETCVNEQCVPAVGAACADDFDCRPDQICLFQTCSPNGTQPVRYSATPGSGDGGTTGLPPPGTGPRTRGNSCRADSDCMIHFACRNNTCIKKPASPPVSPSTTQAPRRNSCRADSDCMIHFACRNNTCIKKPASPPVSPSTTQAPKRNSCRADSDCMIHFACRNNTCIKKPASPPVPPTTTQPPKPQCPQGWSLYKNKCYVVFRGAFTQPTASAVCQQNGGHLANLIDHSAGLHVNQLNLRKGGGPYWIGLQKLGNRWVWTKGTSFTPTAYVNWRWTQPDQCCPLCVANCVLADFQNNAGQWDDAGCDIYNFAGLNFGVACERAPS